MPSSNEIIDLLNSSRCYELIISDFGVVEQNIIRIETKLMRSNGTYVDVFIDNTASTYDGRHLSLSDFGTTWDYLLDSDQSPDPSLLGYIAASYGLTLDGRALSVRCESREILSCLLRLAQACVAVSNPMPSGRRQTLPVVQPKTFFPAVYPSARAVPALPSEGTSTAVVQILDRSRARFEQGVSISVREHYDVRVDVLIRSKRRNSALMIVEHSPYEMVTMRRADHAFAIHADLKEAKWRGRRLSVVDDEDQHKIGYADSFIRLERISRLISTSDLRKETLELAD